MLHPARKHRVAEARSVRGSRGGAQEVARRTYPLAVILPLLAAVPVVPVVILVRQWLGIELLSGA
jgi:hypothetical protein